MSFHSSFVALLPADLNTAISVNTTGVYVGDQPQRVKRTDLEVWVEPDTVNDASKGFNLGAKIHRYNLHVRVVSRREGNMTGATRLSTVKGHMETLVDRYNGTNPFIGTLTNCVAMAAREGEIAPDEDDDKCLEGVVVVELWER